MFPPATVQLPSPPVIFLSSIFSDATVFKSTFSLTSLSFWCLQKAPPPTSWQLLGIRVKVQIVKINNADCDTVQTVPDHRRFQETCYLHLQSKSDENITKFDPKDGGRRWYYQPTGLHGVITLNSLKMPDVM